MLHHFSHDLSDWSSPSFSNTWYPTIPGISDLRFEVSKFQYHTILCSKYRTLLVSSLNLSPIWWWKCLLLAESCPRHGKPGLNFTCTSCIICYQATQTDEIFHIFKLILSYHNLWSNITPSLYSISVWTTRVHGMKLPKHVVQTSKYANGYTQIKPISPEKIITHRR